METINITDTLSIKNKNSNIPIEDKNLISDESIFENAIPLSKDEVIEDKIITDEIKKSDEIKTIDFFDEHRQELEKQKEEKELDDIYGSCYPEDACFYLNPKFTKRSYQTLCDTIVHELLHIKYPNKTEDQILQLERDHTGRYDYVLKADVKQYKKCKVKQKNKVFK